MAIDYYRSTATRLFLGAAAGEPDGIPILDPTVPACRDILFPRAVGFGHDPSQYVPDLMASPDQMRLIPDSEYDARYDEAERTQSSLEHVYLRDWQGECLDQNGQGYCHTADTEVLTDRGFVRWDAYNWSDPLATVNPMTGAMEYQQPFEKHVYDYRGEMVHSTNRRVDFAVTPDHQMYVRKWNEKRRTLDSHYSFVKARDIGWYTGLMHAPTAGRLGTDVVELEVPGDRRYDGDDFFALLGLIVSDGFAGGTDKTRNLVSFASFRADTRPAVAALAARLGFKEAPSRPGVWNRWDAGALAEWVRQNCYSHPDLKAQNKRVPALVKCASRRQVRLFLQWFDDRDRKALQFYTTSRLLADDLQELHLNIGKRAVVDRTAAKTTRYAGNAAGEIKGGPAFVVTVGEADRLCLDRNKHLTTDRYNGLVFCAGVPNHTLVTRRNGTTLISSNCWMYSTTGANMMRRLSSNMPFVRLNPHSGASIVKNGKDEGGWCGLSLQFQRENGIAEEGTGPLQWPVHEYGRQANQRFNDPAFKAAMAKYRITDDFYDLGKPAYEQVLKDAQHRTCLFNNNPCPSDFNWWSHSVCAIRYVRIEAGGWGLLILNSWAGWGRRGLAVLKGSQMRPDGAVCVVASMAA